MMATIMREARMASPTKPDFIRMASRKAAFTPIGAGADARSPSERPNPRIEQAVDEVEDEHRDDQQVRVDRGERNDDGRVELADGVEEQLANPLIVEDRLRDDRTLPRRNQGEREGRHDRR